MFDWLGLTTPAPLRDTSVSVWTPNCGRTHPSIAHLSFTSMTFDPLAMFVTAPFDMPRSTALGNPAVQGIEAAVLEVSKAQSIHPQS